MNDMDKMFLAWLDKEGLCPEDDEPLEDYVLALMRKAYEAGWAAHKVARADGFYPNNE